MNHLGCVIIIAYVFTALSLRGRAMKAGKKVAKGADKSCSDCGGKKKAALSNVLDGGSNDYDPNVMTGTNGEEVFAALRGQPNEHKQFEDETLLAHRTGRAHGHVIFQRGTFGDVGNRNNVPAAREVFRKYVNSRYLVIPEGDEGLMCPIRPGDETRDHVADGVWDKVGTDHWYKVAGNTLTITFNKTPDPNRPQISYDQSDYLTRDCSREFDRRGRGWKHKNNPPGGKKNHEYVGDQCGSYENRDILRACDYCEGRECQ